MDDTTTSLRPESTESSARIAEELRTVVGRLVRHLRAGYTMAPHHFGVLRAIERSGPQTASQLAAQEVVRPQSMAHTLQQLDHAGLVTRHADPSDGRQTLIDLSESGLVALVEQRREMTGWLTRSIDEHLDAGERAVLADAVGLLSRLVDP